MEDLKFFILFFLSIINIDIKGLNQYYADYMGLKYTNSIKGIFVWIIFMQHYRNYYTKNIKYIYHRILNNLGQKMVSLFLFYSGYGIFESFKKKGIEYIKTLPKKALVLYIKFNLILLIFFLNNIILNNKITLKKYILSMIFISDIGNSNWFAFTIIFFYIYCFISFRPIKNSNYILIGIVLITIICIIHFHLVYQYFYPNKLYSIDNTFCFLFGFYYSFLKKYIDEIIMENDCFYYSILTLFTSLYYYFNQKINNIYNLLIVNSIFSLIIVFISMKIRISNEFLLFLNSHSYSIYLLQRVIMIFIIKKKFFEKNEFIRFFIEFFAVLTLSSIFDKYTLIIDKFIKKIFSKKIINKNIIFEESIQIKIN